MTLGESIRSGVRWLLFGSFGNQVLQFAFGVALARLLVPADFGILVTIQIFTGLASLITSGGMGQALVQSKEASEHDFNAVFSVQVGIGFLVYLGFFFAAPLIANSFGDPIYRDLVQISALSFIFRPLINTRHSWLHREMHFRERSLASMVTGVMTGLISVFMAWFGMGVWSLVLGGLIGSLVHLVIMDRLTPRRPKLVIDLQTVRKFSSYGIKATLNDIVSYTTKQVSNLIVSRFGGPSFVGLLNKGESLAMLPFATVSASVYDAVYRAMAKVQDNSDQTKYLFFRMISLLTIYTLPLYIGFAWMAEPFLLFVYGEKWVPAADPLRIIALAGLLICIGHPCGAVLAAQNRLGREVFVHASHGLVVAIACFVGLHWGIAGAAWGIFIGFVYSTPIMYYLATRCFPSTLSDLLRAIIPGLNLNALLLIALGIGHAMLPTGMRETQPALYMIIVGGSAGLIYAAAFLFLPITSLEAEALRWRKTLRLAR